MTPRNSVKHLEQRRMVLLISTILVPLATSLSGLVLFDSLLAAFVALLVGLAISYVLVTEIYRRVKVPCPKCGGSLSENYANSSRGSNKYVEHTCTSCGSKYVDGKLVVVS